MKQKISVISSLGIAIILLAGLLIPAEPASAGAAVWSAEIIPSTLDNILGPDEPGDNLDVRDFSMTADCSTIYAVAGNSIVTNVVYKSVDYGVTWTVINIDITADLVAVAPDDKGMVVIANSSTPAAYLSINGGLTWDTLGTIQDNDGDPAAAIYDIAISSTREAIHYIAAAGTDTTGDANVWYFKIGIGVASWQETKGLDGFNNGDVVAAVEFSPSFSSDVSMIALSEDGGVGVHLQIMDISAEKWNNSAGYLNYPCIVVSDNGTTGLSSASLSLAPGYVASEDDTRTVFIGLTVEGTTPSAVATSGIYRFVDIIKTQLKADIQIHSVAFNGSYLIAGSYDSNTVYRCTNPLSVSPTVLTASTTKYPGGDNKVLVAWLSSSVVAGTSGDESAFSVSTDNGLTFNDISLIDTVIENARDVAVSASGGIIYLVTDDGDDLSLWRKATVWQRVFSTQGTTDYIVRIAPENTNYIYLAEKGTTTIYFNSGGGATQWQTRACSLDIQDMAVESMAVVYALDNTGTVAKTINYSLGWSTGIYTTLDSGATIVSVSTDIILAGSQNGYVAYSTDGNISWKMIPEILEAGAGKVQVIADQYYSSNHIIYAASDTAGKNIKKWQIGTSTEWTDIFKNTLNGSIYGLAIESNILYALEYNDSTHQSTLWLCIAPTTATATSTSWSHSTTTPTTDTDDNTVRLDATPRALKASTGKVWAVKTNSTNKLYSFTDTDISLTLLKPASGFTTPVNAFTGVAKDIPFTWQRPIEITEYELEIALDPYFFKLVTTITVATEEPAAFVLVGPGQPGNAGVNFMPGMTYYWRIRTSKPIYSRYSSSKYFSIQPVMAVLPGILSPPNGHANISQKPAFSWSPVSGAAEYQFILSDNITMDSPIADIIVATTGFTMTRELEYGGMYFWQVRAIKPIESEWSQLANFTVEKQPVEPAPVVTVKQQTPLVVDLPEPPPETIIKRAPPLKPPPPVVPGYLRTAIYIASALLLAVIVLILLPLLTRFLPSPAILTGPFRGPSRRARAYTNKLGKLWEDVAARTKDVIPLPTRATTTGEAPEIDTISFAVRSFLYMTTSAEKDGGESLLSAEEERTLGKKLASGIRAIAGERPLYLAYPEDAAQFLYLWSRYGSREETDRYLKKSFKSSPENALALLKCYLPAPESTEAGPAEKQEFTRTEYNALAQVVDPDNVYAPIAKLLKFRFEKEEDKALGDPVDRAIAYQFVRIHYDIKK
ncbi:MAG: hypothetical protein KAS25_01005 [Dehalococcoidales bacterium]|nr:hypothetical protein [Dehalococcoidales bacterium]